MNRLLVYEELGILDFPETRSLGPFLLVVVHHVLCVGVYLYSKYIRTPDSILRMEGLHVMEVLSLRWTLKKQEF